MSHEDWLAVMVRATQRLERAPWGVALVDPRSGAITFANPAMAALVGGEVPRTVAELVDRGLVPYSDRETLTSIGCSLTQSDTTIIRIRLARSSGPAEPATVHIAHLQAVRGDGSAVLIVASTDDLEATTERNVRPASWMLRLICDIDGTVIAVDERVLDEPIGGQGVRALDVLGGHAYVMTHPADVPLIAQIIRALAAGDILDAEYVVRAIDPTGSWANVRVQACRLHGPDPLLLLMVAAHDRQLRTIAPGFLTTGELEVARALFAGRRPARIAELRQVSASTVRNQINALYRKLDVANVGELTSRFSLPLRPAPPRARVARSPRFRE